MDYDYEIIYKEYFSKVYLCVLTISHDENIAEEITQETFFNALEKIETFNGDCKLYTCLCQIAKNALYDFYKKEKKKAEIERQRVRLINNKSRIQELERLMCRIYEDMIHEKISSSIYEILYSQYETEKRALSKILNI